MFKQKKNYIQVQLKKQKGTKSLKIFNFWQFGAWDFKKLLPSNSDYRMLMWEICIQWQIGVT